MKLNSLSSTTLLLLFGASSVKAQIECQFWTDDQCTQGGVLLNNGQDPAPNVEFICDDSQSWYTTTPLYATCTGGTCDITTHVEDSNGVYQNTNSQTVPVGLCARLGNPVGYYHLAPQ